VSTKTGFRRQYEDSLYEDLARGAKTPAMAIQETLEALDDRVAANVDLVAKNRALRAAVGFCAGVLMGATAKFEEEARGVWAPPYQEEMLRMVRVVRDQLKRAFDS